MYIILTLIILLVKGEIMFLYFIIYFAVVIYITIPICKIIWFDKLDNDLTFLLLTNYILLLLLSIVFNYHYHIIYSSLISLTLVISSFLLIRKIKDIFGYYSILSIPYFIFITYTFANILSFL